MPPNSESVCAAISLADSGSETSTRSASALPPSPLMPSATFCAPSVLMSRDDDGRALTSQRLGVRLADAATGTGDDGHLVLELVSIQPH